MALPMSNTCVKVAIALMMVLTPPAASFARGGGHGGGGFARGFARAAGSAGTGNVPISGIPRGPANFGGINNVTVDPSGHVNAYRAAGLPQPHIAAPMLPGGLRNPAAPPSMNVYQQALGEASGGHAQPRADQVPSENQAASEKSLMNLNRDTDRMINICRGC
jgi:hypothetical protein